LAAETRGMSAPSKRRELYPIDQVFRFSGSCDDFQVVDASANRNTQLMSVDHSTRGNAFSLSFCGLDGKIIILREKHMLP
jgi:hypothetical protein